MSTLEQASGTTRPDRILGVARDVFLRRGTRGVTVAELAKLAHVGKGTMYLYWSSKEDLLIELIAHDALDALEEVSHRVQKDPSQILPHRLFPLLHEVMESHQLLTALHTQDPDLLGVLAEHPSVHTLVQLVGPETTLQTVLTVLRSHDLLRTDLDLRDQIHAATAILRGFADAPHPLTLAASHTRAPEPADTRRVMSVMARLILEPDHSDNPTHVAAAEAIHLISDAIATARAQFLRHPVSEPDSPTTR